VNNPKFQVSSLKIKVDDLRVGMFIVELDRPWTQTRFMLQGFLLTETLDYEALRSLVKELIIDPQRSMSESLTHLIPPDLQEIPVEEISPVENDGPPKIGLIVKKHDASTHVAMKETFTSRFMAWLKGRWNFASKQKRHYLETQDEKNDAATDTSSIDSDAPPDIKEFSRVISEIHPKDTSSLSLSWMERWKNWREQRRKRKTFTRGENIRKVLPGFKRTNYLGKDVRLVKYEDETPIQEEMAHARIVVEKIDQLLKKLTSEIKEDGSIGLEEVLPTVQLLTDSVISNPSALMWLVRMRSDNVNAYTHGLRVAVYMMTLGRHLGFPREQMIDLGFIGLLLDIGKLELPEPLLSKPEKLSRQELAIMRTHVKTGIKILNSTEPLSDNVLMGISEHHERLDGSGYPMGLIGTEISIFGRISAIADSFSAMTSARPYDITRTSFDAMKELFKVAGPELHAPLVEEFVHAIGIFPVGSLIELSSGEVAIVLEHNRIRRLEPKVLILTQADKNILKKPVILDLMMQNKSNAGNTVKILRGVADGAYGLACRDVYQASS
jgi:HD-GYP domain-containing protein (c-di-GMP phosphodiesterase class II)